MSCVALTSSMWPETTSPSATGTLISTSAGSSNPAMPDTCSSGTSAASTTRRCGALGSDCSSRSEALAASVIATYSSSSSSPLEYHSRSVGVTAKPRNGGAPVSATTSSLASVTIVKGR